MQTPEPGADAALVIRCAEHLTTEARSDLVEMLVACVAEGASLGFHAPLAPAEAGVWWEQFPRPGVVLLLAEEEGRIIGTVQMHDVESANGAHRGDVAKLLVHPGWRRRGIGRALMRALETGARGMGKTLLVLDTREGDASNDLYATLGYIEAGRIPGWARDARGNFSATVFWYKSLV